MITKTIRRESNYDPGYELRTSRIKSRSTNYSAKMFGSDIVTVTKLKGMRLVGHIAHMGKTRNACKISVLKSSIWKQLVLYASHIIYYTWF
jgi:hypothetical protein